MEFLSSLLPAPPLHAGSLVRGGQPCGDCPTADKLVKLEQVSR